MLSAPSTISRSNRSLSQQLSRIGHGLLVLFGVTVISLVLPPRPLDPAWQLRIAETLINNGTIALVGMVLISLAHWLNPEQKDLRLRHEQLRRLALVAVIGYLLLIPLQGSALWRGLNQSRQTIQGQRQQVSARLEAIERVVKESGSAAELQQKLSKIPGAPQLPPEQLSQPMPALRERFAVAITRARARIGTAEAGPRANTVQRLIQESLRISLSGAALAFAFAACTRGRDAGTNLLDTLQKDVMARVQRARRPSKRRKSRSGSR